MTVLYFAHARRLTGVSAEVINVPTPLSTDAFWDLLLTQRPELTSLRLSSRLARGDDFLPSTTLIAPTDEIAIIPPVSGG